LDDRDLLARARAGEERALEELVGRHQAVVYRVALRILEGDEDLAADVAQDTFLKAFRALDGFRGDAPFRSWILSIAANEARGALRKRGRRRETALEKAGPVRSDTPDAAERAVVRDEVERVRSAMAELPEKQRLAVSLRLDDGLSFREVGELIGSSEGAARVNYHHGVRRLREMLESK
jgi:RNA polymerase sigma-70 factor (ECF subfamily)